MTRRTARQMLYDVQHRHQRPRDLSGQTSHRARCGGLCPPQLLRRSPHQDETREIVIVHAGGVATGPRGLSGRNYALRNVHGERG
jgi:hypothetical protein